MLAAICRPAWDCIWGDAGGWIPSAIVRWQNRQDAGGGLFRAAQVEIAVDVAKYSCRKRWVWNDQKLKTFKYFSKLWGIVFFYPSQSIKELSANQTLAE